MIKKEDIESYYNSTWKELDEKGLTKPNIRHFIILDMMKKHGLKLDSKVLEIGCGIGTMSSLIGKFVSKGKLVAVDISPETIKLAKFKYQNQKNIHFEVSDMSDWEKAEKFDIIILPDVLEHIPYDQYENLFSRLKNVTHSETRILINIPHPAVLEFYNETAPHLLQIIDLPVYTDILSPHISSINYMIESIEPYRIDCHDPDYQFIVLLNKDSKKKFLPRNKFHHFCQLWNYRFKSWL